MRRLLPLQKLILALADRIQRVNEQRDLMPYSRIQHDIG
jgi:hypothetical protein